MINLLKKRTLCILLCLVMLTLPFLSCNSQNGVDVPSDDTVTVLRLKEDVTRGTKITSAKFEEVQMSSSQTAVGAITDQKQALGKYALVDLEAGDYLVEMYLVDKKPSEEKKEVVLENNDFGFRDYGFVVVTDYVTPNQGNDLSDQLRKLISMPTNINKVFYFPDGEYIISKPLITSSAGTNSIAFKFASNAVLKASDDWDKTQGAMIKLGAKDMVNNIDLIGANYHVEGGIFDGNGRANGIAIEYGRETSIRNLTIVNTVIGLHFNNQGMVVDSDAENITIIGDGSLNSVGLRIQGSDSTFTNFRISNVQTGVYITSPAHILRNIRVTYVSNLRLDAAYSGSYGFRSEDHRCWFDSCVSEGFSTAFALSYHGDTLQSCVATWDEVYGKQVAISMSHGRFAAVVRSIVANFTAPKENCELLVADAGGSGAIYDPMFDENAVNGTLYKEYVRTSSSKKD